MSTTPYTCPMSRPQVVDAYFMEHRAKIIDIGAFLDRLDRSSPEGTDEDFRVAAFRRALELLTDGQPDRARRVLDLFSDHSMDPIPSAADKGAFGAYPGPVSRGV